MNILFLSLSKFDDVNVRGIFSDLMREIIKRGHQVYIASPLERRYRKNTYVIESDNCHILRIKTLNIRKVNVVEKGIGMLLLESQFKRTIKRYWENVDFDLVLYSTPPITFNKVIEWQKTKGAKSYLMLKDIFPQNAVDLGMMGNGSLVWRLFRSKEKRLYRISDRIGCMSPANCSYVLEHNPAVSPRKVELCPNAIDLSRVPTPTADRSILQKYGLPIDRPLFIYGGNLGKPQGIDHLIKVLDRVKGRDDVSFCIVGTGTESHKLLSWYQAYKPQNIVVLDFLPKDEYDRLASVADVGMIFLDPRFTIPNFPSRLLSYLENKMPVLLATDESTDMGCIAVENNFGLWSRTDDTDTVITNINRLAADRTLRKQMGDKGHKFLLDNYTVDKVADIIFNSL